MKTKISLLATAIAAISSFSANAANYSIEARGDAMGGVGTASGTYLTAPFYNPALAAIYRRNDDLGMLVPSFGLSYNDPYELVNQIDAIADQIAANDPNVGTSIQNIAGDDLNFELGAAVAFGIPNQFLSMTAYGKIYTESFVTPDIDTTVGSNDLAKAELSGVKAVTIGVTEAGLTMAKYQTFLGQHMAFGITPKLQRIYTYTYATSFSGYSNGDIRENETAETMFNLDAGFVWFHGPFRIAGSAKNLVGRDIDTKSGSVTLTSASSGQTRDINYGYSYSLRPLYTIGTGIVSDYFSLTVDYDLNKEKKFSSFYDDTQMLRAGIEFDFLRQLQLRAGYIKNLAQEEDENTVTAGIGLSPLNLFEIDIAARYTNENAMGVSLNFLATY